VKARVLAWGVHLFTALGLLAAGGMAALIVRGGGDAFRGAFALMLAATVVDALDGTLARWARVGKVLPEFDGRRLDDIIDFQTYTSLPLLLMWRAGLAPAWVLAAPLLASAYGFCRVEAKTDDGYFLGFPSYWNIVAFYCYFLGLSQGVVVGIVLVLAALTFVPSRYLYPSQGGQLNRVTNVLAVPWTAMVIGVCLGWTRLAWWSLYFPVYYMGASWWVNTKKLSRQDAKTQRKVKI
jgi:phosphatidylcholine synthase